MRSRVGANVLLVEGGKRVRAFGVIVVVLIVGAIIWVILSNPASASPIAYATLAATNGGSVSGNVNFVPTSDGQSTSVTVNLQGLQRDAVYAATINQGDCLGPRLFILSAVPGDANGQGSSTTTVAAQPRGEWFIAIHATASPDAPLVACGQVHVTGATGPYTPPSGTTLPGGYPAQQPYQMPNGGGAPPRTPIPTPVAAK
jgi:hypothetical protein